MLVKIEARFLIFPGTDFRFPSTSVPPGTFFRLCSPDTLARFNGAARGREDTARRNKREQETGGFAPSLPRIPGPATVWWMVVCAFLQNLVGFGCVILKICEFQRFANLARWKCLLTPLWRILGVKWENGNFCSFIPLGCNNLELHSVNQTA